VACKANHGKTPFELWYGRRPAVHHLRTFGCIAYVKDTTPHLKKLDDRGRKGIFIGYEKGSKAYCVYDPITNRVIVTRNVVFDESASWKWSGSGEGESSRIEHDGGEFTVQYRYESVPGQGGGDDAEMAEEDDDHQEPGDPVMLGTGVHHFNPLFDPEDEENLDADCDDAPLHLRRMSEIIRPAVPPGRVDCELANNEDDRVYTVSAEEPTSVTQAAREVPWCRAMEEELQAIEENRT
jgi:hypothetical protein